MAEKVLMKGNEAIAEAAIKAGCRHYFGYPITPQTEIAAYMAKRVKTESEAFTPFGVGGEFWTILKSPFAGLDTIESTIEFTKVLNPFNYEAIGGENAIIQAGRYKGKDKAYKAFMNSPFIPMNKTIYKLIIYLKC